MPQHAATFRAWSSAANCAMTSAGDIALSVRLWKRPDRAGGRYRVGPGLIEIDAIELVPFAAITQADIRRREPDSRDAASPRRARRADRRGHARLPDRVPCRECLCTGFPGDRITCRR